MREDVVIPKQQNLVISRARLRDWDLMHEERATLGTMHVQRTHYTHYTLHATHWLTTLLHTSLPP